MWINLEASSVIKNTTSGCVPNIQLLTLKSITLSYTVRHKAFVKPRGTYSKLRIYSNDELF